MARISGAQRELPRFQVVLCALRVVLCKLGGADIRILAKAWDDATEMTARGIAALVPAVFGGLAVLISFTYAYSLPFAAAAAAGAGWAAVVLCLDLSLMRAAPDRHVSARMVTFGSRAIVSVLAALTFASPIVMFMFAKDITVQVAEDQQTDLARYNSTVIVPAYAARITTDQGTITADQHQITQAEQAVRYWQKQVRSAMLTHTCEVQGVSQSFGCPKGTGLVGNGRVSIVRATELDSDQAALASTQAQAAATRGSLSPQIASAQADLRRAKAEQAADYAAARTRYGQDDGLIARWRALGELEATSPGVRTEVWLLEGLIIAIDLTAVITKVTSKTPSYNRVLEAIRKKVALRAAMAEDKSADAVELRRAEHETRADIHQARLDAQRDVAVDALDAWRQVQQSRIRAWVDEQTRGQQSHASAAASRYQPRHRHSGNSTTGATPDSRRLSDLVTRMRLHERMPDGIGPSVRHVAWIGVGLLAALGAALILAHAAHAAVAGGWLVALALAAALALAILSHGFRRGTGWAQVAAFGTALVGLALPVVIAVINIT